MVKTFADRERVVFWNWPLPVQLDYGKEATPTVTVIVSLFDQMTNALVEKQQKKKCLISITEIINAQARRSLRVRGSIRTNVKPDDNNQ